MIKVQRKSILSSGIVDHSTLYNRPIFIIFELV
jgi:hypothetical protein